MEYDENSISGFVLDACIKIHREFGPGLLERVYEDCLCFELDAAGIPYERQKPIPLQYNGHTIGDGFRADLVVADSVIIELKSVSQLEPVHFSQLTTYLKLTGLKLGLLINFNEQTLIKGFHRIANRL